MDIKRANKAVLEFYLNRLVELLEEANGAKAKLNHMITIMEELKSVIEIELLRRRKKRN